MSLSIDRGEGSWPGSTLVLRSDAFMKALNILMQIFHLACQEAAGRDAPDVSDFMVQQRTGVSRGPFAFGQFQALAVFLDLPDLGLEFDDQPGLLILIRGDVVVCPSAIEIADCRPAYGRAGLLDDFVDCA